MLDFRFLTIFLYEEFQSSNLKLEKKFQGEFSILCYQVAFEDGIQ